MFVNSPATLSGERNRLKRQISEMEKAAKAAFGDCSELQKWCEISRYCCGEVPASPSLILASLRRPFSSASKAISALF
ncbi:TPA: hypothetical protein JD169_05925 [Cronobacter malonaticus]|nr:hypothetical protein [Cronobacter malonaticus]